MKSKKIIASIAGILLIIATLALPYAYYMFLRVIILACGGLIIYKTYQSKKSELLVIFVIITLVFNPFLPLSLKKESWVMIDLLSASMFFYYGFFTKIK